MPDIRSTVCKFVITNILFGDGNAIRSGVTYKRLLDWRRVAIQSVQLMALGRIGHFDIDELVDCDRPFSWIILAATSQYLC